MQNQIEFKLTQNFKCKRCGCNHYDKLMYTGMKTLNEENAIMKERYVCRNCDFPFDINEYLKENVNSIKITPNELLNQSNYIDEGVDFKVNGETIKKENKHE